jgi:hypothetical protein
MESDDSCLCPMSVRPGRASEIATSPITGRRRLGHPEGSAHRMLPVRARECRSSLWTHLCGPGVLARCGCRRPIPRGAWRSCAGECDRWPASQSGLHDRPLDGALQHALVKIMSIPRPTFVRRMTATCRPGMQRGAGVLTVPTPFLPQSVVSNDLTSLARSGSSQSPRCRRKSWSNKRRGRSDNP